MPVPAFKDLVTPTSTNNGLLAETKQERILSLLAMLASGSAPDGTTLPSSGGATSQLTLTAHTPTETPLTIKGAAGQTADQLDVVDSNNNILFSVAPTGSSNPGVWFGNPPTATAIRPNGNQAVLIGNDNPNFSFAITMGSVTNAVINVSPWFQGGEVSPTNSALATTATSGFWFMRTCAGAPTGTPSNYGANTPGCVPYIYDTTNHKIWIYDGTWKGVVVA